MIEFSHVYKTYTGAIHALRDVCFSVSKGEFAFLTGPSGAGKTTIFKMIAAYDIATSGSIQVGNFRLNQLGSRALPEYRRRIGVVFQDFKLVKSMTIFENVALPLRIRKESETSVRKKTNQILDQLNLFHKKDMHPEFLSGGEQQRAAIARGIIHQPEILIADEPTGNLDPELSEEIMDLLEKVCAQGTTVLVATHDHAMVHRRNKRHLKIQDGTLLAND